MSLPLASGTVISYPIPAYQNMPIRTDFYKPRRFIIQNITLGPLTTVFATTDMDYVIGQQVRLIIPANFGSYQLNKSTAFVVRLPSSNSVTLKLDSSQNVDAFVLAEGIEVAQILAIGDVRTGARNEQGNENNATFIPGSFINISPE